MTSEPSAGRWKNLEEEERLCLPSATPTEATPGICHGSAPPQMVEEQRDIQAECDPLSGAHEHQAEEAVDGVLRDHQLPRKETGSPPWLRVCRLSEVDNGAAAIPGKCYTNELHVVL